MPGSRSLVSVSAPVPINAQSDVEPRQCDGERRFGIGLTAAGYGAQHGFVIGRMTDGGFSAKFFTRIGLADRAEIPLRERAALAAGLQSAIETIVLEMAGKDGFCTGAMKR